MEDGPRYGIDEVLGLLRSRGIAFEETRHPPVYTVDDMLALDMPHPDRIAKNRFVADRRIKALARRGLVEILGGLPCIASGAGQEVVSAYTAGSDQDAVMDLIRDKGFVTRSDVAEVLASRDSKELTEDQLRVKATNLLQTMRKAGLVEKSEGSTRSARYVLAGNR